uniref:Pex N-terminal domain-containing protein n=1 Tax=Aegilops tauschii subsp. strangulata TaxID=200361 RepID=A0A452YCZ8_AEGTS
PYFKSKLQSVYNKEREARLQASLWDQGEVRFDEAGFVSDQQGETSQAQVETTAGEVSHLTRLRTNFAALIGVCYPWIHATHEGLSFAYQLLYLLDATAFYSPGLHVLGLHVCRATGQELMDSSSRISRIRSRELERLRGPPWLKTVQRVLLNCTYTTLDYAQTGLIAAVFFFKMMEWWYQSAEERMSAPTVYPPPPPPPLPKDAVPSVLPKAQQPVCSFCFWFCVLLQLHIQVCLSA